VLLVDDQAVIRTGLRYILAYEPLITVVGEAADGLEAIEKAGVLKPDLIMMDMFMPVCDGLKAADKILEKAPQTHIMFLTISDSEEDLYLALRTGAASYMLKTASVDEILKAVKSIINGDQFISPSLIGAVISGLKRKFEGESLLSERELEVMIMLGEGKTNSGIAEELFISENTVRTHLQRIFKKLNLKNRFEAISYSNRHHLS
jgi:DNA-binding NarL/FixJ family response regulator